MARMRKNPGVTRHVRVGTEVVFDPTPASLMLYSRPPETGERGVVTTVATGSGKRSFMPGPGGGLVYVNWTRSGTQGVSPIDLSKASKGSPAACARCLRKHTERGEHCKRCQREMRKNPAGCGCWHPRDNPVVTSTVSTFGQPIHDVRLSTNETTAYYKNTAFRAKVKKFANDYAIKHDAYIVIHGKVAGKRRTMFTTSPEILQLIASGRANPSQRARKNPTVESYRIPQGTVVHTIALTNDETRAFYDDPAYQLRMKQTATAFAHKNNVHVAIRGRVGKIHDTLFSMTPKGGMRSNPRAMPIGRINEHIENDLKRLDGHVPENQWGNVKTILSWLRGNEMSMIAGFFVDSLREGPKAFLQRFYIDDRVSGKPVATAYSRGKVGRRDVTRALRELQASLKGARSNPSRRQAPSQEEINESTVIEQADVSTSRGMRGRETVYGWRARGWKGKVLAESESRSGLFKKLRDDGQYTRVFSVNDHGNVTEYNMNGRVIGEWV